jgi:hypothetical protein
VVDCHVDSAEIPDSKHRKTSDGNRAKMLVLKAEGKRLTYKAASVNKPGE